MSAESEFYEKLSVRERIYFLKGKLIEMQIEKEQLTKEIEKLEKEIS